MFFVEAASSIALQGIVGPVWPGFLESIHVDRKEGQVGVLGDKGMLKSTAPRLQQVGDLSFPSTQFSRRPVGLMPSWRCASCKDDFLISTFA